MISDFDAQKFKNRDAGSYDALTAQFDYFTERFTSPLAERVADLAQIAPYQKVLDVGTGTGIVALSIIRRINGRGEIYGIDLSEEMLERAQKKFDQLNHDRRIIFRRMDAEKLDFENEMFDVAVSLFALLHFPNPLAALQEIFRVLRPGGKLVIAVGSGVPLFSPSSWLHLLKKFPDLWQSWHGKLLFAPNYLNEFINNHNIDPVETEESDLAVHHKSRIQKVNKLIKQAGFKIQKKGWQGNQNIIDQPEDFWELQRTFSSIARKRLASVSSDKFDSLRETFLNECRIVQSRGGRLVYPVGAYFVVASRQAAPK